MADTTTKTPAFTMSHVDGVMHLSVRPAGTADVTTYHVVPPALPSIDE